MGGSGTWDNSHTGHWSNTSGGAGGQSVPTASDSVRFDGNSGGAINVSLSGGSLVCASFNATGYNGVYSATPGSQLSVSGNINLADSILPANLTVAELSTATITCGGGSILGSFIIANSSGTVTLADSLTAGSLNFDMHGGAFNANNQNINVGSCLFLLVDSGSVTMGSGTWSLSGTGAVWDMQSFGALTPNTSIIKITDSSTAAKTFNGNSRIYNNLWLSGSGPYAINGNNTFADFKIDGLPNVVSFQASNLTTVATFTVNGAPGQLMTLQSTISGNPWNLSCAAGQVSCNYLSLKDSHAFGGAIFRASNSVDAGGNTGWTFPSPSSGMMMCF